MPTIVSGVPPADVEPLEVLQFLDTGIDNELEQVPDNGAVVVEHVLGIAVRRSPVTPEDRSSYLRLRPPPAGVEHGRIFLCVPQRRPGRLDRESIRLGKEPIDRLTIGDQLFGKCGDDRPLVLHRNLFPYSTSARQVPAGGCRAVLRTGGPLRGCC